MRRNRSVENFDREIRALSRNRQTRESVFLEGVRSGNASSTAKSIDKALRYMSERQSILREQREGYEKQIVSLFAAIHEGKTYTKVIKARFYDMPELVDLTGESDFTMETISKSQLARVGAQCDVVCRMFVALNDKASKELMMADCFRYTDESFIE